MPDGTRQVAPQQRAYSLLTMKSVNEDERVITGIASTPETDRMGDIVEPKGAQFKLPLPLLYQHNSSQPIGQVTAAKVTDAGIEITAKVARNVPVAFIEEAWQLIKAGLVRGLSIGFAPVEYAFMKEGGVHFTKWDWFELSAVTVPANADASIQTIKSIDTQQRAANGAPRPGVVRLSTPSAVTPGKAVPPLISQGTETMKTIAEQIAAFEAKRAASSARMSDIMTKAGDEGRTLDDTETQEYDGLATEVKAVDSHLQRLKEHEKAVLAGARPATGAEGDTSRGGTVKAGFPVITQVEGPKLEKGQEFGRWALAMAIAKGNVNEANAIVQARWKDSRLAQASKLMATVGTADLFGHFGVEKATVTGGDSTTSGWASQLAYAQNIESEFVEYLRPRTVVGRIDALVPFRRVPFNFRTGSMTGGTTASWVGQGAPVPVSKPTTSSDTLGITKVSGLTVVTDELLRLSSPSVEMLLRDDLAAACAYLIDTSFLDPNQGGVANVQPASIFYGVTANQSAGTSYANFVTDVKAAFAAVIAANQGLAGGVWVGSESLALALSLSQNSLGQMQYPGMSMGGGTLIGLPFVASQSAYISGSPDFGNMLGLVYPREIFLADDGSASIEISGQTAIQMLDNPTNNAQAGTATTMVSMFQTNSVAIKVNRPINWKARDTRVPAGLIRTTAYA